MMPEKTAKAVASMIYMCRQQLQGNKIDTDDKRIRASGLYDEWTPGKHEVGEIYNAGGQTWECFQAYDNAVYPDIIPGNAAWFTFNRPLHATTVETAREFVPVQGAHDMYHVGEFAVFENKIYECIADTAYSPADYPAAWRLVEVEQAGD